MDGLLIRLAELGCVPDRLVRAGIRRLLARRLDALDAAAPDAARYEDTFAEALRRHAVAEHAAAANAHHYELPPEFFAGLLGPRLKYSAAYYAQPDTSLAQAEVAMLDMTASRAELQDGQEILELGCGWGALTLWIAERFPHARITAVTNSARQAAYVHGAAGLRGLRGVRVLRADINEFLTDQTYDRIVSVEMFEHVRNYALLFGRLRQWLDPEGKLFIHVFSHRRYPYLFEAEGPDNWMGRHFFTGGTMPSHGLLPRFAGALPLEQAWRLDGRHYARTLEDWLQNLDRGRGSALRLLAGIHGARQARVWLQRWRLFLMACAELFAYREGTEWGVSHYRFAARARQPSDPAPAPRRRDAGGGA
jgi:cyclopropane-fatty-acyl-phospholipid synthase